jgi:hypothetical protein
VVAVFEAIGAIGLAVGKPLTAEARDRGLSDRIYDASPQSGR